jgi:LysR family hydrogen peroxide-inducible transcriptional activator
MSGQHDFIITPLPVALDNVTVEPLFREPLKLVVPGDHRLASRARVTRNYMAGEEVLTLQDDDQLHMHIQRLCDRLGADVNSQYESTSLDTLRQMVMMGMGLAFLPALYIHAEIRPAESLSVLAVSDEDAMREHAMVWRRTSPSRQLFRDLAERLRSLIKAKLGQVVTTLKS